MTERRYSDKEIAAIFRNAAETPAAPERDVPADEGFTLTELQAIGKEVGIAPDAIVRAARALDVSGGPVPRTVFGLPLGVSRTVNLGRTLTNDEWDRLVVQLREVFNARGSTRSDGSLRQWTNGNLQVLLEPVEGGHRLRFRTVHGAARAALSMGLAATTMSAVVAIATAVTGHLGDAMPGVLFLLSGGLTMMAMGVLRLPRWARLRARQMDALAARVAEPPRNALPPA